MTWKEGHRIVDICELARQMNCKDCGSLLDLNRTTGETRAGLASVLYVGCQCGVTNHIHTSKKHSAKGMRTAYLININASIGVQRCKLITEQACRFLRGLGIPATKEIFDTTVKETIALNLDAKFSSIKETYNAGQPQIKCENDPCFEIYQAGTQEDAGVLVSKNILHDHRYGVTANTLVPTVKAEVHTDELTSAKESYEAWRCQGHSDTSDVKEEVLDFEETNVLETQIPLERDRQVQIPKPVESEKTEHVNFQRSMSHTACDNTEYSEREEIMAAEAFSPVESDAFSSAMPLPVIETTGWENSIWKPGGQHCKLKTEQMCKLLSVIDIPATTEKRLVHPLNLEKHKEIKLNEIQNNEGDQMKTGEELSALECEEFPSPTVSLSVMDTTTPGKNAEARSNTHSFASNDQLSNVALLRPNHFSKTARKCGTKTYVINDKCAPFKCGECGARFALERALNLHKKAHSHKSSLPIENEGQECSVESDRQNEDIEKRDKADLMPKSIGFQVDEKTSNCQKEGYHSHYETWNRQTSKSEVTHVTKPETVAAQNFVFRHPTYTTGKGHSCPQCSYTACGASRLRNHMRIHTGEKPFKCGICEKSFADRSALSRHTRFHSGNLPHVCQDCDMRFPFPSELNRHRLCHSAQKDHTCPECKAAFTDVRSLNLHIRIHTDERSFLCEICQKSFRQSGHLHRHLQTHKKEKSFLCQDCGKTFATQQSLNIHYRIHTGEQPFKCLSCPATFRHYMTFVRHLKHHRNEKYLCEICHKSYSSLQYYKEHHKIHRGEEFLCQECGKKFLTKLRLKNHQRLHQNTFSNLKIKTFCCEICSAIFNDHRNFNRHKRIHTGVKRYSCKICNKQFHQSNGLKAHMQVHLKSQLKR